MKDKFILLYSFKLEDIGNNIKTTIEDLIKLEMRIKIYITLSSKQFLDEYTMRTHL